MSPENFPVATAFLLSPGKDERLLQNLFVKLYKSLAPGRAAGGTFLIYKGGKKKGLIDDSIRPFVFFMLKLVGARRFELPTT